MAAPRYPKAKFLGQSGSNARFATGQPEIALYHYTAGGGGLGTARYLMRSSQVSCHFVVDRDGTVYQISELDRVTWHAGASKWDKRIGINKYAIGIEIANYGYWRDELLKIVPSPVKAGWIKAKHKRESRDRYWEPYTEAQIKAVEELTIWLLKTFPTIQLTLGHDDVSPGRKSDPGPAFPWQRIHDARDSVRRPKGGSPPDEKDQYPAVLGFASMTVGKPALSEEAMAPSEDLATAFRQMTDNSLDREPGDGEVEVKYVDWYRSRFAWGLVVSVILKLAALLFNWTPASFGLEDHAIQELVTLLTLVASFVGDVLMTNGRVRAVSLTKGVARKLLSPFAKREVNDNVEKINKAA